MESPNASGQVPLIIRQAWFRAFVLGGALTALSYLTWFVPALRGPALLAVAAGALYLAWRDARLGFLALLVEAVVGSHGHLITAGPVSLRMALFAAALIGWVGCRLRDGLPRPQTSRLLLPLLAVLLAVAWGAVRGLWLGHGFGAVFADANAYVFILAVPLALDLFRTPADRQLLWSTFAGAALWLAAWSVALLYFFSHDFGPWLVDLYQWQRKFGLSEITRLGQTAWHRVFAASDLFLVPAFAFGVFRAWTGGWKIRIWTTLVGAALLLSFSRSFTLGLAAGALALVVALAARRSFSWKLVGRPVLAAVLALAAAVVLLLAVALLPFPPSRGGFDAALFGARLSADDAAVTSRWNLLSPLRQGIAAHPLLGSGFGTTVTYRSDDPRLISLYPGGVVTTGAIEWQYLEIWLKQGLPGLLAFGWLIVALLAWLWRRWPQNQNDGPGLPAVALLSFVALVVLNVFTPYWNHPLGWLLLALLAASVPALSRPVSGDR